MFDRVFRTMAGVAILVSVVACVLLYRLDQRLTDQHNQTMTAMSRLSEDFSQRIAEIEAAPAIAAADAETPVETADIELEEGWRASTISVAATSVANDLVVPGSIVDVLYRVHGVDGAPDTTMTLLEAVQVKSVQRRSADGRPMVSLILTPVQAKMLAVAVDKGDFHLVLRNPSDQLEFVPFDLQRAG